MLIYGFSEAIELHLELGLERVTSPSYSLLQFLHSRGEERRLSVLVLVEGFQSLV